MVCASQTVQSETAKTERRLSLGASCRCGPLCVCSQGNDSPSRKRTEQHLLSHKVHPRLTWTLGWPSVFVTWLNPKENKLLTSSWQEVALRFAARHPLKLGLQPCKETGTQGLCRPLTTLQYGPRSLRKTILGIMVSKRILELLLWTPICY